MKTYSCEVERMFHQCSDLFWQKTISEHAHESDLHRKRLYMLLLLIKLHRDKVEKPNL